MKVLISLTFFILSISIHSCVFSGCEKIKLTKKDLTWVDNYKDKDTLIFRGNCNQIDTFVVSKIQNFSQCNKFELSNFQYENVSINLLNKKKVSVGGIVVDKKMDGFIRYISCFDLFSYKISYSALKKDFLVEEEGEIDSTEIYQFEKGMNYVSKDQNSSYTKSIKSFYWSIKYGLIQYETIDGCIFRLVSPPATARKKTIIKPR